MQYLEIRQKGGYSIYHVRIYNLWFSFQYTFSNQWWLGVFPVGISLLKVNYRNTRTVSEICSKLTIKTVERRQLDRSGVFVVNYKQISHIILMLPLLTLKKEMLADFMLVIFTLQQLAFFPNTTNTFKLLLPLEFVIDVDN